MDVSLLAAPFPRASVHWRSQSLTRNGDKAMALAYIDARDVMDRLDLVCGPENWQSDHLETARGRVITKIGVFLDNRWVWKSDGAGETAVEGEKGGISDSFKRAAVCWGVGRYLYRVGSPWVPCETYEKNGKAFFKSWKESPWDHVRGAPTSPDEIARDIFSRLKSGQKSADIANFSRDIPMIKALVPSVYDQHIKPLLEAA